FENEYQFHARSKSAHTLIFSPPGACSMGHARALPWPEVLTAVRDPTLRRNGAGSPPPAGGLPRSTRGCGSAEGGGREQRAQGFERYEEPATTEDLVPERPVLEPRVDRDPRNTRELRGLGGCDEPARSHLRDQVHGPGAAR